MAPRDRRRPVALPWALAGRAARGLWRAEEGVVERVIGAHAQLEEARVGRAGAGEAPLPAEGRDGGFGVHDEALRSGSSEELGGR